jgi:hypothetical protein
LLTKLILKMSINKGINETQRVPQAVAAGPLTEITDSIRSTHKETVEMLSHINHTLSMYKLQISDLKAQLNDIKQTMQSDNFKLDNFNQVIMQELQHIKESDAVMKSDIENIKNIISKSLSQPTKATPTTAPSTAEPTTATPTTATPTTATPTTAEPTTAPSTAEPTTATPTTAPSTAETMPTTAPSTAPSTATPTTAPSTAETTTATPTTAPSTAEPTNLLNNEINNTTTDSDLLTQLTSEPQKVTVAVPKAPRGRRPRK